MRFVSCALVALGLLARTAFAAEPCARPSVSARAAVACAVATHPSLAAARQRLSVIEGRRITAGPILPSFPELSVSVADRRLWVPSPSNPTPALNVYATLSQRIEFAGQRSLRLDTVDAEMKAEVARASFAELSLATETASAYYVAAAAMLRAEKQRDLRAIAARLAALAEARKKEALLSTLDATLMSAEAARITFEAEAALLDVETAKARLHFFVPGAVDSLDLGDDPAPWQNDDLVARAIERRADLVASRAQVEAHKKLARQIERERVPAVTLSGFIQSDGFNERVLGGGVSIPIVLPAPLGPSRRGEIDAARAEAVAEEANVMTRTREIENEVTDALAALHTAERQAAAHHLAADAEKSLQALVEAIGSGQIPVREGLYAARTLIDFIQRAIFVRTSVFLARIALARAAALPIEEVLP